MQPEQAPNDPPNQQQDGYAPLPRPRQPVSPIPPAYQPAPGQPYDSTSPRPMSPDQQQGQFIQQIPTTPQQTLTTDTVAPAGRPKKAKWLVVVLIAIVLLIAAAILVLNKKGLRSPTSTTASNNGVTHSYVTNENTALAALKQKGSSLTSSSLASVNATDLFYAVFRNASEQPIVTTTTNRYWTPELNGAAIESSSSHANFVSQAGYDYEKGQLAFQANLDGDVERCVNGVEYNASTDGILPWTESGLNDDCQVANTTATINDGLNTGGLSMTQAQNFVDAVRDIQALVKVTKASIVDEQGKPYIRLDVAVNANTDCYHNSVPSGVGCFGVAFNYLKLPKSWPYTTQSSIVSGAQLAYFVDPTTQLPAYMQLAYTPVTATEGNWSNQQIEYNFGPLPAIQASGAANGISLSWPVAQL